MAKDPYKYFRVEARELLEGLTQGVLQLEKGTAAPDLIARLLRLAHTLKGAARVVRQPAIAELAHTIEGCLTAERDTSRPLSSEQGSELLGLLDKISVLLQALEPVSVREATRPAQPVAEEPLETLRVEIHELNSLLRAASETAVQLGAVRKDLGATDRLRDLTRMLLEQLAARPGERAAAITIARARSIAEELRLDLDRFARTVAANVERVEGQLGEIHDVTHRLRLVPAHTIVPSLDRVVRDAAQALGKRVEFAATGGDVRLDANVLSALRDALAHVVRNAVAHGIEAETERVAAGKPPTGRVWLAVERRGNRVSFVCGDDGRGVDVEAVRTAAIKRGLVHASEAKTLTVNKVLELLRHGGLSTSREVTELSGRGIGLDVVRATTSRLNGEMSIRTEPGRGATVEVQVPVSIASVQSLLVEVAGAAVAIPLDAIRQTLRLKDNDIARSADREAVLHEGELIPFLPLERALRRTRSINRQRRTWSAVVVEAASRRVAIGVDRLLGTSDIVMRALPGLVEADPVVSGASLDSDGNPQLVLEPSGLIAAAERGSGAVNPDAVAKRSPILVIDDSLTTRMLEQSILESAGYEVEVAVSAEEGLAKARDRHYCLFVVDVEMPGMDGFGFVAETRGDPVLRETPAILVTSRNAAEDRRRGEQVGARAYIVKGEFDQQYLLKTIERLIG